MIPAVAAIIDSDSVKKKFRGTVLSLDPGETTGWSVFYVYDRMLTTEDKGGTTGIDLVDCGQVTTPDIESATREYQHLIVQFRPDHIVAEDYRVYGWKVNEHSFSEVITARLVGNIETLCTLRGIPFHKQMAQIAKQFCTDDKLKVWDLWIKGKRHARDAIRHAIYWILFNYPKLEEK